MPIRRARCGRCQAKSADNTGCCKGERRQWRIQRTEAGAAVAECERLLPPKHDAGTATRHYRAFWQRRCRAAAAGAVLKPQGGNCAVLPILSQVAGHLLLLKSSNYSRLVSKEILCVEIQIVLLNKFNTKIALYSRHFTSRFHVFVYQAACQSLPSLSPYQLSPFSLSRQIPSFGRLF